MEQYISKSTLVVEIEKLIANGKLKCQQSQENNDQVSYVAWSEHIATCGKILSLIDTLNVKEAGISIPNIDDILKKEGLDPDSKEAKIFKEIYYLALERFLDNVDPNHLVHEHEQKKED